MTKTLTLIAFAAWTCTSLMAQTTNVPPPGATCAPTGKGFVTSTGTPTVQATPVTFQASVNVHCNVGGNPAGTLSVHGLILNGSPGGTMTATSFARLSLSPGAVPTGIMSGGCTLAGPATPTTTDCRYWILFSQLSQLDAAAGPQRIGVVAVSITRENGLRIVSAAGKIEPATGTISISPVPLSN